MSLDKTSDYYYRVLEAINEFTSTETGSRLPTLDLILKTETNGSSAKAAALGVLNELLSLCLPFSETPRSAEDQLLSARQERLLRQYAKIIGQLAAHPLPMEDS